MSITGEVLTVKVRVQVSIIPQLLVTVNVTVETPPQKVGAPVLLFVKPALQPPVKDARASHAAYFILIACCVWQEPSTTFVGQVNTTAGAAVTVNDASQVVVNGEQLLV